MLRRQARTLAFNFDLAGRYAEPKTFRQWFISVQGKVVTNGRKTVVKMSVHYLYAREWGRLAEKIPIAA